MDDSIVVACPRGDTLYIWKQGDTLESVAKAYAVDEDAVSPVKESVSLEDIQPGDAVCITTRRIRPSQNPDSPSGDDENPSENRPSGDESSDVNGDMPRGNGNHPACDIDGCAEAPCVGRGCAATDFECPDGYRAGTVRLGDTYATILKRYNISYDAFRLANPTLNINRLMPGQRFCVAPGGERGLCVDGLSSYIISVSGGIDAVASQLNTTAARLLSNNPTLAPTDFIPGRVICTG